jgi:SAM-dependent methyltransferase
MDRTIFDTIPAQFDRWRPRYCPELFAALGEAARLGPGRELLEIGPGTGQATESLLRTGCSYTGIELGDNFCALLNKKYGGLDNFRLIHSDFETFPFAPGSFDAVCSAAAIQWIPEDIAFPKCFSLLRSGGVLAMMYTVADLRSRNEALYQAIERVYSAHFRPTQKYDRRFNYTNAENYGFKRIGCLRFPGIRQFTADEYVSFIGTHSDHISLREPERSAFFGGIRDAILAAGDKIVVLDTYVLHLYRRP